MVLECVLWTSRVVLVELNPLSPIFLLKRGHKITTGGKISMDQNPKYGKCFKFDTGSAQCANCRSPSYRQPPIPIDPFKRFPFYKFLFYVTLTCFRNDFSSLSDPDAPRWCSRQRRRLHFSKATIKRESHMQPSCSSNGISGVDDLADFDKDSLKQLADNLRRPGGCIPDPNPAAVAGATIPTPAFVFGAKSQASV